jgi:hypothetical protein
MTTYVDLVSAGYPVQHRCRLCGVALRLVHDRVLDNAGNAWCWQKTTQHVAVPDRAQPVVTPSPLMAWRRSVA